MKSLHSGLEKFKSEDKPENLPHKNKRFKMAKGGSKTYKNMEKISTNSIKLLYKILKLASLGVFSISKKQIKEIIIIENLESASYKSDFLIKGSDEKYMGLDKIPTQFLRDLFKASKKGYLSITWELLDIILNKLK